MKTLEQLLSELLGVRVPSAAERAQAQAESLARLAPRAARLARDSIGHTMRIRTDRKTVVIGRIVACEPVAARCRGRSNVAQFRVVLECGESRVRREFTVEKLPH